MQRQRTASQRFAPRPFPDRSSPVTAGSFSNQTKPKIMKHQNHFQYAEIDPIDDKSAFRTLIEAVAAVAVFAFIGLLLAWRG